jgi:hypothetical protein
LAPRAAPPIARARRRVANALDREASRRARQLHAAGAKERRGKQLVEAMPRLARACCLLPCGDGLLDRRQGPAHDDGGRNHRTGRDFLL